MQDRKPKFQFTDVKYYGMTCSWVVQDIRMHRNKLYVLGRSELSYANAYCYIFIYSPGIRGKKGLIVKSLVNKFRSGKANFWTEEDKLLLTVEISDVNIGYESSKSFIIKENDEIIEYEVEHPPALRVFELEEMPSFYHGFLEESNPADQDTFRHLKTIHLSEKHGISLFTSPYTEVSLWPIKFRDYYPQNRLMFGRYELAEEFLEISNGSHLEVVDVENVNYWEEVLHREVFRRYEESEDKRAEEARMASEEARITQQEYEVSTKKRKKRNSITLAIGSLTFWIGCTFLKFDPKLMDLSGNIFTSLPTGWSFVLYGLCTVLLVGVLFIGGLRSLYKLWTG